MPMPWPPYHETKVLHNYLLNISIDTISQKTVLVSYYLKIYKTYVGTDTYIACCWDDSCAAWYICEARALRTKSHHLQYYSISKKQFQQNKNNLCMSNVLADNTTLDKEALNVFIIMNQKSTFSMFLRSYLHIALWL